MKSKYEEKKFLILVIVLWIAGLGAAMQFAKVSVPFSFIQEIYPSIGPELGFLVSLISFLGIALGLFSGLIVAHIGFRRLLIFALLLGAAMSLYQSSLPSFTLMLTSRLIEGASHLIIVVAAPTLIAQLSAARYRNQAMTLWSTFFGVAFALVAWFGLPLVTTYGLPFLFIVHAFVLLIVATILAFLLPKKTVLQKDVQKLNLATIIKAHISAYRSPFIAAPAIGWLFYTFTFVAVLPWKAIWKLLIRTPSF